MPAAFPGGTTVLGAKGLDRSQEVCHLVSSIAARSKREHGDWHVLGIDDPHRQGLEGSGRAPLVAHSRWHRDRLAGRGASLDDHLCIGVGVLVGHDDRRFSPKPKRGEGRFIASSGEQHGACNTSTRRKRAPLMELGS